MAANSLSTKGVLVMQRLRVYMRGSNKVTKADEAYQRLRHQIVTLQLPPGAVLDERALASQLGIGRTPLREALARLAEQNLVLISRHRSSQVAPLDLEDVAHIYELRVYLEPLAARLASQRATEDDLNAMRDLLAQYDEASLRNDHEAAVKIDFAFHATCAQASHNPYLADAINRLNFHSQRLWLLSLRFMGGIDQIADRHRRIYEAIAGRNPEEAYRLMREHVDTFRERVRSLL